MLANLIRVHSKQLIVFDTVKKRTNKFSSSLTEANQVNVGVLFLSRASTVNTEDPVGLTGSFNQHTAGS